MRQQLLPALRMTALLTVLTGLLYPFAITGLCSILFSKQAHGTLVPAKSQNAFVGSRLIGQNFTKPEYFHPRPSAAGDAGYDASSSGGSNLGPTSQKLYDRLKAAAAQFRKENPGFTGEIPADAITTSASGIDPDISIANAEAQAPRVAAARQMPLQEVMDVLHTATHGRDLGFLGEARVNVLDANLALDQGHALK
jgi:K+-transporting ATPase ATPase C chain